MTITRYSKRKNINERESINTKLKVTDYVFNYNNEDFNNATLEYYFDKIKNVEMSYEDEKKIFTILLQAIGFKSCQKINLLLKYNTKHYLYGFMLIFE